MKNKDYLGYMNQCTCDEGYCNRACYNWVDKDGYDDETD